MSNAKEKAVKHIKKNCPIYFKQLEEENRVFEGSLVSDTLDIAIKEAKKEVFDDIWNANLINPKDDGTYKEIEKHHLSK